MKREQENMKSVATGLGEKVSLNRKAQLHSAVGNAIKERVTPQKLLGVSEAMMEGVYSQAYNLYNSGNYAEAEKLFRVLIMISAWEPKFSFGLAACMHMLKNYKSATETYAMLMAIDPENPVPYYHTADCCINLKDSVAALIMLNMAIKKAGDKPEYRLLRERASLMKSGIEKEVNVKAT